MDLRKLKKLIDLVEESGIAELEVTEGEEKVRIEMLAQKTRAQRDGLDDPKRALIQAAMERARVRQAGEKP